MSDETTLPIEEFDPVSFDLANGDQMKVSLGVFWTKPKSSFSGFGHASYQFLAIRFYSNEDSYPRRLQQIHELRHGKDFEQAHCPKLWRWLKAHVDSRNVYEHEDSEDFLSSFKLALSDIIAEDEDMLEHLESLPAYTLPDAFDQIDDSIFTDQRDPND